MDHYAFLLIAMTVDEAKETLGFPPGSMPSDEEIKSAWKKKIFEAHPDRGGNLEEATAINVAKDILEGKARPTYGRPSPASPPSGETWGPAEGVRWEKPKEKKVTFDEAKSKAGVPHADWKFIAEMKGKGWSSDESMRSDYSYVVYGMTESKHVFVAMRRQAYNTYFIGGGADEDVWTMKVLDYPIKDKEGQTPSWLYGNVVKAFKAVGADGRFNSKVYDLSGKHWTFSERFPSLGAATSLKHWLVNTGAVSGDDPSVATRKQVIELSHETAHPYGDRPVKPGFYEEPHERWNFWDGAYHGDYHKFVLLVNNAPYDFTETETQRFLKLRLGGKRILNAIYGDYPRGGKKVITRLRAAKPLLNWFAENLALPQAMKDAVSSAASQVK